LTFTSYDLDARIVRGIQAAGYTSPTPIQAAALPLALAGRDLIGTAQTGTGKTAAFVLPLLQRLLSGPRGRTRALIVTPTRELAEQIHGAIRLLGRDTDLRSATIYGGVGMAAQQKALRGGVEILVACPGRLLDHIDRGAARLGAVEVLVIDEADRMFDMGFMPAVRRILQHVPTGRQTLLFSATFPPEVDALAASVVSRPERVAAGPVRAAATVSHALYPVAQHLKAPLLLALLHGLDAGSVLVFARTRHRASRLAQQLGHAGYRVAALHSDRSQSQRQAALDDFRSGKVQLLVATDIAARGLDVEGISHVINFDIPDTADAYIHRIGRTGRAERLGDAFTLVTPDDTDLVRAIERALGGPVQRLKLAGFDYAVPAPPRVAQVTGGRGGQTGRADTGPIMRGRVGQAANQRTAPSRVPVAAASGARSSDGRSPATAPVGSPAPGARPFAGGRGRSRGSQRGWRRRSAA
jgi:ATP-dependent RNA helicase RhlE